MLDRKTTDVLLEIIEYGVLNARFYAQEGNCEQTLNEINHIHNLPALIRDGTESDLRYYLDVERESYIRDTSGKGPMGFDGLWERIGT